MIQPRCEGDDGQGASQRPSLLVPTMLKALLRERNLQSYGMFKREYQKAVRGLDKDLVDTYPSVQTFRRWLAGRVKTLPHAEHCAVLESMLPGWTVADLFRSYVAPGYGAGSTLLQELLRRRCIHDYRAFCRAYNIAAATIDKSLTGTYPAEQQFHRWISGDMIGLPYPDHCNVLETMFPGYSARQLFGPHQDDSSPLSLPPAAVSTVTQPQPTQTYPSHDADRLGVPTGHEATVSSPTPAGPAQAERITGVLTSCTFTVSVTVEMPAGGDNEIRDQLANLVRGLLGMINCRKLLQLPGWAASIVAASPIMSGLNPDRQRRLALAIASPSRVDAQVIDHIEAMLQHCKRREGALGPRAVLGTALAEQALVESLLTERPDALQPRLLSVYSDMSTSIGYYYGQAHCFRSQRDELLISPTVWSYAHQVGRILLTRNSLLKPLTVHPANNRRSNKRATLRNIATKGRIMEIWFLGKETEHLNSPTLYATDRGTYLIQGWKVTDPEILAKLDVPQSETVVEIYARLMAHLAKDGLSGAVASWIPPIVHVKQNGNLVIQGERVTDPDVLAEMNIPSHEDVVEIDKAAIKALLSKG